MVKYIFNNFLGNTFNSSVTKIMYLPIIFYSHFTAEKYEKIKFNNKSVVSLLFR